MNTQEMIQFIQSKALDPMFHELYGEAENARERYLRCVHSHQELYGDVDELLLFSTPGRTEIGGNHTDHQNGRVLAGAVSLDIIAAVSRNTKNIIRLQSEGYPADLVDLWDLHIKERERNKSAALIRGVAARIKSLGHRVSGFDAYTMSDVLGGSGLSSSAAFEVLIAQIMNTLFCEDSLSPVELAMISQYAENTYFGKPSGLMDQTACAVGDCVALDFENPANPAGERIDFDLAGYGYQLVIVNCRADHAFLTADYASIPADMKAVSRHFGKNVLREVSPQDFYASLSVLRKTAGDRAVLRAAHFFDENERVVEMKQAILDQNISRFLELVDESGRSSYELLQNIYSEKTPREQSLAVALCVARRALRTPFSGGARTGNEADSPAACAAENEAQNSSHTQRNGPTNSLAACAAFRGACRVHGGGFAGTIQAYVPNASLPSFVSELEAVFGEGCCQVLTIRKHGAIHLA